MTEVEQVRTSGVHGLKLQFWDGPERDVPRLLAAREVAGDGFPLMHDAAGAYDLREALDVGRALGDAGYEWFEEPIPDEQITNLRSLRDALDVPVLAAETVSYALVPEYLHGNAVDRVRGDVLIKSGITGMQDIAALCELNGVPLEIHTAGTPLLDIANLHVACSSTAAGNLETHHEVFRFGLVGDPLAPDANGMVALPDGPGLGVELDWDWIDDHTVGEM